MNTTLPALPLALPDLSDLEAAYVNAVMQSGRLALGPWLEGFEERMAILGGTEHAVAVNSGTAALHLIVRGLGLGAGDEVITTPYSFVASSNCLLFEGVKPVFVDIDPDTFLLDPNRIEKALTPATKGILGVDVFGLPADWPALTDIASRHNLVLIDDACEAPGASAGNRSIGSWGNAGAFGFYPNKPITSGEGGCITTNDAALAEACRSMRNQGRGRPDRMEHVRLGYNYRLPELSAAVGAAQIERWPALQSARAQVAGWYGKHLAHLQPDLTLPGTVSYGKRSWFVYVIRLGFHFTPGARDDLQVKLAKSGIASAPYFPSIHLQPYYRERFGFQPGAFPICESVSARTLALPFYTALTEADVARVAKALEAALPELERTSSEATVPSPSLSDTSCM